MIFVFRSYRKARKFLIQQMLKKHLEVDKSTIKRTKELEEQRGINNFCYIDFSEIGSYLTVTKRLPVREDFWYEEFFSKNYLNKLKII